MWTYRWLQTLMPISGCPIVSRTLFDNLQTFYSHPASAVHGKPSVSLVVETSGRQLILRDRGSKIHLDFGVRLR